MLFIVSDGGAAAAPATSWRDRRREDGMPAITIERAGGVKCERCWRIVPAVSSEPASAGLCDRCQDALAGTAAHG